MVTIHYQENGQATNPLSSAYIHKTILMSQTKRARPLPLPTVALCLLLLLTTPVSAFCQSKYVGTYANAAGDDGASDTLFAEMEIFDGRFSLRFVTREGVRESGRTGRMPYKQLSGTWEADTSATGLNITYYRPGERRGGPPVANTEHYSPADGEIVALHFKGGKVVRGIFTTKHFPELPPALCLAWGGDKNLVFANWSRNRRGKGGLLIRQ